MLYAGELEIRLGEGLVLATGRALTLRCASSSCSSRWRGAPGAIITREELYATVWGGELRPGDRSVDVYVSKLRGKLERRCPTGASSTLTRASATASSPSPRASRPRCAWRAATPIANDVNDVSRNVHIGAPAD